MIGKAPVCMTTKKVLLLTGVVVCALASCLVGGVFIVRDVFFAGPKLSIEADNDRPGTFKIRSSRINSILGITFYSETGKDLECLWKLYIGRTVPPEITYGKIHGHAEQKRPRNDAPPRTIKPGEIIYLYVSYQYDQWFGASGGSTAFVFRMT